MQTDITAQETMPMHLAELSKMQGTLPRHQAYLALTGKKRVDLWTVQTATVPSAHPELVDDFRTERLPVVEVARPQFISFLWLLKGMRRRKPTR